MTTQPTTLRNIDLETLVTRLEGDQTRKVDVVVGRDLVEVTDGRLQIADGTDHGAMVIEPGPDMIASMSARLRVPTQLARELHTRAMTNPEELDDADPIAQLTAEIERNAYRDAFDSLFGARFAHDAPPSFMLRTYRSDDAGGTHYGRAMLSRRYNIVDNRDVLLATLSGIHATGTEVDVVSADLTDARMRVRVQAPAIAFVATELLKGYRSPFRAPGEASPLVFAGFEVTNSEIGGGAFAITPRMVVEVCSNGLVITKDVMRCVHLGSALDEGEITWAADTQRATLEVIKLRARDAVAQFLSAGYLEAAIRSLEATAAVELTEPTTTLEHVAKRQAWTEDEAAAILDLFVRGGQCTAGGVMQAMTAHAQAVGDPDRAAELEALAVPAMELAAQRA